MRAFTRICLIGLLLIPTILTAQNGISEEYSIGPRDLLEIKVFNLDAINRTVRVSETGMITLPLLGEIEVGGLSIVELERKLVELLKKDVLQDPQVSVFVKEYESRNVSVLGAVGNPGLYELHGNQTLLQIIAQAGSLTQEAGAEIIVVRKQADGEDESIRIPIDDLFLHRDENLNIALRPNDIVTVPPDREVTIFVYGKVNRPGALQVKRSEIPTLQRAIAQAGGFAEGAAKGGVVLTRKGEDGKETRIKVNIKDIIKGKKPDIQLEANDVIYVPESIW